MVMADVVVLTVDCPLHKAGALIQNEQKSMDHFLITSYDNLPCFPPPVVHVTSPFAVFLVVVVVAAAVVAAAFAIAAVASANVSAANAIVSAATAMNYHAPVNTLLLHKASHIQSDTAGYVYFLSNPSEEGTGSLRLPAQVPSTDRQSALLRTSRDLPAGGPGGISSSYYREAAKANI